MEYPIVACALLARASAHTISTQLHVNGVAQGHTEGIWVPVRSSKRSRRLVAAAHPYNLAAGKSQGG
jgi:hypothetical protein